MIEYKWENEGKIRTTIVRWKQYSFSEEEFSFFVVENKITGEVRITPITDLYKGHEIMISDFKMLCEACRNFIVVFGQFYLITRDFTAKIIDVIDVESQVLQALKTNQLI